MTYDDFFRRATITPDRPSGLGPFPYQVRLASGTWPDLIDVPTGLGKTAAVIIAWLHRSLAEPEATPRRLVYCLPTRALVEQTAQAAQEWIDAVAERFEMAAGTPPGVSSLLGGLQELDWVDHPENRAVIVGTQDMLLSRALMRGYGMTRFKWPVHYALLHNDALWVFDETQLMGVGVETSAQFQALRDGLGTSQPTRSIWMSATLGRRQLETVDHPEPANGWKLSTLDDDDLARNEVSQRLAAEKSVRRSVVHLAAGTTHGYGRSVAERTVAMHRPGTLTLVIVNRVERAQDVYRSLLEMGRTDRDTVLLHSRFRPVDRGAQFDLLEQQGDRIAVSTQVLEAGIDISAATMLTELAPWPSMVQRFGRCNRYGEVDDAVVEWIDLDLDGTKNQNALPYSSGELEESRAILESIEGGDAGPQSLGRIHYDPPSVVRPVVRRKDVLDLFDTTPDLSGNDLDVSRWVRDDKDTDVAFFWRVFHGVPDRNETGAPLREELCRVSISQAEAFLKGGDRTGWAFDRLEGKWVKAPRPRPGQQVLIEASDGGYDPVLGWLGAGGKAPVPEVPRSKTATQESIDSDHRSRGDRWLELARHVEDVVCEGSRLGQALDLDSDDLQTLIDACRWHDIGKAHLVFQRLLLDPLEEEGCTIEPPPSQDAVWAKSNHRKGSPERPHFRHELASALAYLECHPKGSLVAYMIAAHHGKVRMSLRSLPGEKPPPGQEDGGLFARGVWHGDELPEVDLGGGVRSLPCTLDLSLVRLGRGSWLDRTIALRDDAQIGPFRLAWSEMLLRIADQRASAAVGAEGGA